MNVNILDGTDRHFSHCCSMFNCSCLFLVGAVQTDNKYCHRLATIVDKQTRVSNDVTVCSGRRQHQRSVSHVTADSATVEVRLYWPSTPPSHTASSESFGAASMPHSLLMYEGRSLCPGVSSSVNRSNIRLHGEFTGRGREYTTKSV